MQSAVRLLQLVENGSEIRAVSENRTYLFALPCYIERLLIEFPGFFRLVDIIVCHCKISKGGAFIFKMLQSFCFFKRFVIIAYC